LSSDLVERCRAVAEAENKSLSRLIEDLLIAKLATENQVAERRVSYLPRERKRTQ
jgi:hypothetical protein